MQCDNVDCTIEQGPITDVSGPHRHTSWMWGNNKTTRDFMIIYIYTKVCNSSPPLRPKAKALANRAKISDSLIFKKVTIRLQFICASCFSEFLILWISAPLDFNITRLHLVLQVTLDYYRLLQVTRVYFRLLQVITDYYMLLQVTLGYYRLLNSTKRILRV